MVYLKKETILIRGKLISQTSVYQFNY